MILLSAQVRDARVLAMDAPVTFDPETINVVHGPNGSGKSTMFGMMHDAFVTNHNSTAASLGDYRPRGAADAAPQVVLTFEHCGNRYRLEKQFLKKPFTRLQVTAADGGWRDLETGKGADEKVRSLVRASGIGDTGLLSMLWCPQGKLPLTESISGNVVEDVRSVLGAQVSGRIGHEVERAVQKRWDVYLTETGKLRKNSPLTPLEEELATVRKTAEDARATLQKIESYRVDAEKARTGHAATGAQLRAVAAELAVLEMNEAELNKLRNREEKARLVKDAAHREFMAAQQQLDAIRRLRTEIRQIRERIPELESSATEAEARYRDWEEADRNCRAEQQGLLQFEQEAKRKAERLLRAEQWTRLREEAARNAARIEYAGDLERRRREALSEIESLAAPDAAAFDAIDKQAHQIEALEVRRSALALCMRLDIDPKLRVNVEKGARRADAITGIGEISIEIEGVGAIRVTGPDEGAQEIESSLSAARAKLAKLCEPFGSSDIAELSSRARRRRELEEEIRGIEGSIKARLDDRPFAYWAGEQDRIAAEIRRIDAIEPEWTAAGPHVADLRVTAARAEREVLEKRKAVRTEDERVRPALPIAASRRSDAAHTLQSATADLDRKTTELAGIEADGLALDERVSRVAELRRKADSADEEYSDIRKQLDSFDPKLPAELEDARARKRELDAQTSALSAQIRDADASQRALLGQASYATLALAEERISDLEAEIANHESQREGVRLLTETLKWHRDNALRGVPGPVAAGVQRLAAEFAGRSVGEIVLADDFRADGVIPEWGGGRRNISIFSGGEQEQIHLAVRLALADHCAANEKQVMVLDDSLLNTDNLRLKRVFQAIESRRDKLQWIILTCHPERYESLRDVNRISLEQLARG